MLHRFCLDLTPGSEERSSGYSNGGRIEAAKMSVATELGRGRRHRRGAFVGSGVSPIVEVILSGLVTFCAQTIDYSLNLIILFPMYCRTSEIWYLEP